MCERSKQLALKYETFTIALNIGSRAATLKIHPNVLATIHLSFGRFRLPYMRLPVVAWILVPVTGSGHLKGILSNGNRLGGGLLKNLRGSDTPASSNSPSVATSTAAIIQCVNGTGDDESCSTAQNSDAQKQEVGKDGGTEKANPPKSAPADDMVEEVGSTVASAPSPIATVKEKKERQETTKAPKSTSTSETEGGTAFANKGKLSSQVATKGTPKGTKESKMAVTPSATPYMNAPADDTESQEKDDEAQEDGNSTTSKGGGKTLKGDSLLVFPPAASPIVDIQDEGSLTPSSSTDPSFSLLGTLNACSDLDLCDDLPLRGAFLAAIGYWMSKQLDDGSCVSECTLAMAIAARKVGGWQCGAICDDDINDVLLPLDFPSIVPIFSSEALSDFSSDLPSMSPLDQPSMRPSDVPSDQPSMLPSDVPSDQPSILHSDVPSDQPSMLPSDVPSIQPSTAPLDFSISVAGESLLCDETDECRIPVNKKVPFSSGQIGHWMAHPSEDGLCARECSLLADVADRKSMGWSCGSTCNSEAILLRSETCDVKHICGQNQNGELYYSMSFQDRYGTCSSRCFLHKEVADAITQGYVCGDIDCVHKYSGNYGALTLCLDEPICAWHPDTGSMHWMTLEIDEDTCEGACITYADVDLYSSRGWTCGPSKKCPEVFDLRLYH